MTKQPYFGAIGPLTVYQAGLPMMRVGKFSDGGYVVASLGRNAYDLYLAGGVNDDTSFDLAFFQ